jgi:hypothetical protein
VDEKTDEQYEELATDRGRGDLLLVRHNMRLLVDVTVRRPTAKTELRLRRGAPLASAAATEKRKHKTYDVVCARDGSAIMSFAMESYGAKGKQAQRLLFRLVDASEELSAQALLLHASAALSVALQCGNADIAARGTQSLRMRQVAALTLHASHLTCHEPAGRRHRKHSLQPSGGNDADDRW